MFSSGWYMRKWEILIKMWEFPMISLETIKNNIIKKWEILTFQGELLTFSWYHENIRKGCDRANNWVINEFSWKKNNIFFVFLVLQIRFMPLRIILPKKKIKDQLQVLPGTVTTSGSWFEFGSRIKRIKKCLLVLPK